MANIKNKLKIVFGQGLGSTHVYLNEVEIPALDVTVHVGQDNHHTTVDLKLLAGDVTLECDYHITDEQDQEQAKFALDHAVEEGKKYAR